MTDARRLSPGPLPVTDISSTLSLSAPMRFQVAAPGQFVKTQRALKIVFECVGTQESMTQALQCARPGAMIGIVGVPHGMEFDGKSFFFAQVGLIGGPAPVRRFLPHLIDLMLARKINPRKVFYLTLPWADAAEGYRAMDERRAIKTLLRV